MCPVAPSSCLVRLRVLFCLSVRLTVCPCAEQLNAPSAKCYVCGRAGIVTVRVNANTMTFGDFLKRVLVGKLNFVAPSVTVASKCVGLCVCVCVTFADTASQHGV